MATVGAAALGHHTKQFGLKMSHFADDLKPN
jgi:hypothetical protein